MREERVLVLDTCGERSSLLVARGEEVVAATLLEQRAASSVLLRALRGLLHTAGWQQEELTGVGVVNGPGSFTGLRIGLAVAKGLCEALQLPVAAVSRLEVLARSSGLLEGWAVLRAGRDEVYVRGLGPRSEDQEVMLRNEHFLERVAGTVGQQVMYAESSLAPLMSRLPGARLVELGARQALPLVQARLRAGGDDVATLDANYVRDEQAIYRRNAVTPQDQA